MNRLPIVFVTLLSSVSSAVATSDSDSTTVANSPSIRARFISAMTLPGAMPRPSPWSPSKPVLVYHDRSESPQCHAIDLAATNPTPWTIFESTVQEIAWSPDGTWIVAETREFDRDAGAPPYLPMRALTAFPVLRSLVVARPEKLAAGRDRIRFLWGCDGKIWYRESEGQAEWQNVDAPDAWKKSNPTLPHSCIRAVHHEAPWRMVTGSLWIYFVETGPNGIQERPLSFDQDVPAVLSVSDSFISDGRILAMVYPMGRSPYQAVINVDGTLLAKFEVELKALPENGRFQSGFYPVSVSADGTLLAGTRSVEDGHAMYFSEILIGDVDGKWVVPLEGAPQGMEPCFARQGSWIAFQGFDSDSFHVGRVELERGSN